jgi:hypothetical protein
MSFGDKHIAAEVERERQEEICPVCGSWNGCESWPYCSPGCKAEDEEGEPEHDEGALDWTDWESMGKP